VTDDAGRIAELTRQGQRAALALARRLGLPAGDPVILSSRGNLLLRLAPAPVVARVATLTALSRNDPFAWLAREVAVAGYVAGRGGPVVAPSALADPGPHRQDGFAISLWEYVEVAHGAAGPAETGAALAQLHRAAAGCPADLGDFLPARDHISEGLDALERDAALDAGTLSSLRELHARLLAELAPLAGPSGVLHGDAHPGNLLRAGDGRWLWIDLEETSRGPLAWDLAVLAGRPPSDEPLRAYAAEAGTAVPDLAGLVMFGRARLLEGTVWSLGMAGLYPARYRDVAQSLLAEALAW
jgi:aminoglycoside phosphotransferase (APT) family kinase protein